MKISKELLEKAKSAKTAEELLKLAKAEGVELSAEQAAQAFAEMNKAGEISDAELENASGGGCSDSGDTPKFYLGQRVWKHANRGCYPVTITYVSTTKKSCGGIIRSDVFTYSVQPDQKGAPIETDVPEYDLEETRFGNKA